MTLSDLEKFPATWSVARPLCYSITELPVLSPVHDCDFVGQLECISPHEFTSSVEKACIPVSPSDGLALALAGH